MKRKLLFISCILIFLSANSYAGILSINAWNTFEGNLGKIQIQMSIYLFNDSTIKGNYVIRDSTKKNLITGYKKGDTVVLKEVNSKAIFKGIVSTDTFDIFEGTWLDRTEVATKKFKLYLSDIHGASYDNQYDDFLGTSEEVESFVFNVKTAILDGNKEWIANHISYPIHVVLKKRRTSINNKEELIKHFNEIFTLDFKNKIRHSYTTNLFEKTEGIMFSDGRIWITNTENSTENKYAYTIAAINN